jgi:hypothetical protein
MPSNGRPLAEEEEEIKIYKTTSSPAVFYK